MTFGEETAEDKSRWTEHKLVVVLLRKKAIDIKEQAMRTIDQIKLTPPMPVPRQM
jgi:hypothetical protein